MKHFYNRKAFNLPLILIFVFACVFLTFMRAKAENMGYASKIDVIFAVDASRSMTTSDPQNLSAEAMKLFLDMCHVKGDRGGVVVYSGDIVREVPLGYLNSEADKAALKNSLMDLQQGEWTDIGLALKRAVSLINEGENSANKPIIILLSDGKNDPQRPKEVSQDDLNAALNEAKFRKIPVYTIGLNADGTVDKDQLEYISGETGGKSFITNSASDLPQILKEIFADSSRLKISQHDMISASGEYQDVPITIPDSNIVESNIVVLSYYPVELALSDNNGKPISMPSERVLYAKSDRYSMIKIISPEKGTWTLKVKGSAGDSIDVSLISNYDIRTVMNTNLEKNIYKGDKVAVSAYVESNGKKLDDKEFISTLQASICMKNLETGETNILPMNGNGDVFTAEITIPDDKSYELTAKIEGAGFSRESEPKIIGVKNRAPIILNKKKNIVLWTKDAKKIELSQFFKDEDGDKLSYEVSSSSLDKLKINIKNNTLELQGRQFGTDKIVIAADDGKGGRTEKIVNVHIWFLNYILPAVAAVLFVLFVSLFVYRKKKEKDKILPIGKMMIQVKDLETGRVGEPWLAELEGMNHIFSVYSVLKSDPQYKDTEKILLKAIEEQNLQLVNNSKCIILLNGKEIKSGKEHIMKNNDIIEITLPSKKYLIAIKYYPWSSLLSVEQLFEETSNLIE